ncbi:MAG: hypothetical protein ACLPKW_15045, partial [Acetobacteraceae bacterium]
MVGRIFTPQKLARKLVVQPDHVRLDEALVGFHQRDTVARKLLWREYPTDQRGSYFRQFWSVG